MFKVRYALMSSLALLAFACNHENQRDPAAADADLRGPSSPDSVPVDATTNVTPSSGGSIGQAGDVPGPGGGFGGSAGMGGGVGRSANDGMKDAPSTIGTGH